MKKVIVSLYSDSHAMRECIIGIFNYVNAGHDWNIRFVSDPLGTTKTGLTPQTVRQALKDGIDGIITGMDILTPGFKALVSSGIPLALNNEPPNWQPPKGRPIVQLHNDDLSVGRMGARYLQSKGKFQAFAFFSLKRKCFWGTYRKRGFDLELAKSGIRPVFFDPQTDSITDWVASLPKPVAIMAAADRGAFSLAESVRQLKLKIPEQVAILGVDNDELYCKSIRPYLSSIHPNHLELGRRAAQELDRLMHSKPPKRLVLIPPIQVVERESTRSIPPAGHIITEGIKFIRANFRERISVRDVADHLGISESLLRLRFRTVHGKSVKDVLLDTRLEEVKRLLSKSRKTVSTIAAETGFSSTCRLTHFFTKRSGISPQAWRLQK